MPVKSRERERELALYHLCDDENLVFESLATAAVDVASCCGQRSPGLGSDLPLTLLPLSLSGEQGLFKKCQNV